MKRVTEDTIDSLKKDYAKGMTYKMLEKKYEVSLGTLSKILKGLKRSKGASKTSENRMKSKTEKFSDSGTGLSHFQELVEYVRKHSNG